MTSHLLRSQIASQVMCRRVFCRASRDASMSPRVNTLLFEPKSLVEVGSAHGDAGGEGFSLDRLCFAHLAW